MRVAFLTHEPFYPPSGGGSAEAVYLVQELIQRGHDVHLFCPAFPEPERIQRLFAAKRTASSSISSAIGLPSKLPINRPAPGPSQEGGKQSSAPRKFPSGEGSGAGSDVPGANVDRGDLCAPEAATGGDSAGLQCHLFTTWPMGRYTSLRNFKYLAYPFFLGRMVERAARHLRFDLVLGQHAISAVAAGRLKRKLRVPVVMNFLDYLTGFMETWPRYIAPRPFIKALERFELAMPNRYHADGLMTVSDTLADYFAKAGYPRERIRPIYYGYDAALFRPLESSDSESAKPPIIVMHGSFDHHHLGRIALEALERVARNRPEVKFKFVGKQTPALVNFRKRAEAMVAGLEIECTGFVPYSEIARHLANATVGIVPYEESTGTHCAFVAKIVEYLGVGLPVVSTPLDSARRYFASQPAVRFSRFDGESFGEGILSWLEQPLERRRGLGQAASQRVQAELDWSAIGKRAIDFVELIQQQQGRG